MDPALLVPIPDALPVAWVWLLVLLTFTTFLHLVAMNVMFGTGIIALAAPLFGGESTKPMVQSITGTLTYSTALTINLGVAPLLFLQTLYGQFFYTSTVLMAVYWLSIVFLLIITYYSIYLYKLKYESSEEGALFIGIPVAIMLIVSLLFTNNISLMQMPESWLKYFDCRSGLLLNLGDATIIPRYLHFVLSAIAVGGLAMAAIYEFRRRRGEDDVEQWIKCGCNWFTLATILNFGVGFWFLDVLPENVLGSETPFYKLFMVFIILSVATIIPAMITAQSKQVYKAVGWTLLTVLLMTVAREIARMSYLKPYFSPADLPVTGQYSPFVVFLVLLVAVVCLLWWMFRKVRIEMEVQ